MNEKRTKLHASIGRLCRTRTYASQPELLNALNATLVFAQEEAGTAVCISPTGLLLTCSHCVSEDAAAALSPTSSHWLIFATGVVVKAICVAWDGTRDLALLQITHAERPAATVSSTSSLTHPASPTNTFPYAKISASSSLSLTSPLFCIGHPGSEDLESPNGGATGYDVLHISEGVYHGMAVGQNPQDNSEIGALMHNCWTYWGHSGAPILTKKAVSLEETNGMLVGLHSSWDDQTGMRRGVPLEAIAAFLREHTDFGSTR